MDVISDFISRYTKEIDFYENVARRARDLLDAELRKEGVKGAVSHRAKSIDRLEEKCKQRNAREGKAYVSVEGIYEDIVDLAGVRVALYFPSDRDIVASTIARAFDVEESKVFPDTTKERSGEPRFSGYAAKHFRVRFKDSTLPAADKRYATARIEIQIASVFMHGWSEVEHDLVYKPLGGGLSAEEYALLDQLNGLAISAEIALENLQKAIKRRVTERERKFGSHYELTTYLLGKLGISDRESVNSSGLGRMDHLFSMLARLDLNSPMSVDGYVNTLHDGFETRPLADQVIDELLREDESRYSLYEQIRNRGVNIPVETLGSFLSNWIRLEHIEQDLSPGDGTLHSRQPFGRQLERLGILDRETMSELRGIRSMRNRIVHGQDDIYSLADIENATDRLADLTAQIVHQLDERRPPEDVDESYTEPDAEP